MTLTGSAERDDFAHQWRAARPARTLTNLDVARCSSPSDRLLGRMIGHLRLEQRVGGYQAAEASQPELDVARDRLRSLVGGRAAAVEFLQNGTESVHALLDGWPLPRLARVAAPRSEFASNRMALERLASRGRVELQVLPETSDGRLDLARAGDLLERRIDLIVVSQIASQRGIVQPIAELVRMAHGAGAAVILDVCQSLGHIPVPAGADAYAGTSRKWLHGPRGVGFVIVTDACRDGVDGRPTLQNYRSGGDGPRRLQGRPAFEFAEAPIAMRIGLAHAIEELHDVGLHATHDRFRCLGAELRQTLSDLPGWRLREPVNEPSALVTLEAPHPGDPTAAVEHLRRAGIAGGVVPAGRALDHAADVLRLAPEPGTRQEDIARVRDVLWRISS